MNKFTVYTLTITAFSAHAGIIKKDEGLAPPLKAVKIQTVQEYSNLTMFHPFVIKSNSIAIDNIVEAKTANAMTINGLSEYIPGLDAEYNNIPFPSINSTYKVFFHKSEKGNNTYIQNRDVITDWTSVSFNGALGYNTKRSGFSLSDGQQYFLGIGTEATKKKFTIKRYEDAFTINDDSDHSWWIHNGYPQDAVMTDGGTWTSANKFSIYRLNGQYPAPISYNQIINAQSICNTNTQNKIFNHTDCKGIFDTPVYDNDRFGNKEAFVFDDPNDYFTLPNFSTSNISTTGEYTLSFWIKNNDTAPNFNQNIADLRNWKTPITLLGVSKSGNPFDKGFVSLGGIVVNSNGDLGLPRTNYINGQYNTWVRLLNAPIKMKKNMWTHVVLVQRKNDLTVYIDNPINQKFGDIGCLLGDESTSSWPNIYYIGNKPHYICTMPKYGEMVGSEFPLRSLVKRESTDKLDANIVGFRIGNFFYRNSDNGNFEHSITKGDQVSIDEIMIFDKALSAQEVNALHDDQILMNYSTLLRRM
ncbi:hypothetical protein ACPV5U_28555 [Vibrio mediterranei]